VYVSPSLVSEIKIYRISELASNRLNKNFYKFLPTWFCILYSQNGVSRYDIQLTKRSFVLSGYLAAAAAMGVHSTYHNVSQTIPETCHQVTCVRYIVLHSPSTCRTELVISEMSAAHIPDTETMSTERVHHCVTLMYCNSHNGHRFKDQKMWNRTEKPMLLCMQIY